MPESNKANEEFAIINSGNLGRFYKHVNCRIHHKSGIAPIKHTSGQLLTADSDKAEAFSSYFSEIGVIDDGLLPPSAERDIISVDDDIPLTLSTVDIDPLTVSKFINIIMNAKSAPGPDGLFPIAIKKLSAVIVEPLSFLLYIVSAAWLRSKRLEEKYRCAYF